MNPVNTSVIMNPIKDTTRISEPSISGYINVKSPTAVKSLIPRPANVIGVKPMKLAIGNKNKKIVKGIGRPSAITKIYSCEKIITQVIALIKNGTIRLLNVGKSL